MNWRPKLHDHFIARTVILSVMGTWGVLLGLDVVLAFANEFGSVGKGSYTVNHAIAVTGLSIPWRAYTLFPTAAVIGSLLGLGQLAGTSELTALRAIGLSRRRLSASVAFSLTLLTLLMVANGETLAPWGEERAQSIRSLRNSDMVVAQYSGLWAREGEMFLNARTGEQKQSGDDKWLELRGVRLFQFDEEGRLQSIANVEVAEHRPGGWLLIEVGSDQDELLAPDLVAVGFGSAITWEDENGDLRGVTAQREGAPDLPAPPGH